MVTQIPATFSSYLLICSRTTAAGIFLTQDLPAGGGAPAGVRLLSFATDTNEAEMVKASMVSVKGWVRWATDCSTFDELK